MTLKKNILANYAGTALVVIAPIFALPYYLNKLGAPVWGLISFAVTFQAILSLIDAGISQILLTEFAKAKNALKHTQDQVAILLFGFEKLYWCFSLLVGVIVFAFSSQIADYWLKLEGVSHQQAQLAVIGTAVFFIFQFPGSVYRSLLLGTQNQILLNVILSISTILRHCGGVLIVLHWPTLEAYLVWHGINILLETATRAYFSWKSLNVKRALVYWDTLLMKKMIKPIVNISGAVLLGALTIQIDKVILSGMVTVEKFGYYAIASTIATGIMQLVYPVVNAVIPYAVQYKDNAIGLRNFNFKYAKLILIVIFASAIIFVSFGLDILSLWLKNELAVNQIYSLLNWLLFGTALNALYTVGYINWIIKTKTANLFKVNFISLIVAICFMPALITSYGLYGACIGWIAINTIGLCFSVHWLFPISKSING